MTGTAVFGLLCAACAAAGAGSPDVRDIPPDLEIPPLADGPPAPGRRVRHATPGWENTRLHCVLYLPREWKPGARFPVLAEFPGNGGYTNRFGDRCDGRPEDCRLGYGLSAGTNAIWVCLPFVDTTARPWRHAVFWWGDAEATARHTADAMRHVCRDVGGDPDALILCGFSRGSIACNYIGLRNDEVAGLWRGFLCHSHYDGVRPWPYPDSGRTDALRRLSRLRGRPQFISQEGGTSDIRTFLESSGVGGAWTFGEFPFRNHTDEWVLRDCETRRQARAWMAAVLGRTHPAP